MIFTVAANGWLDLAGVWERCALGRGGVAPAADKREGDGATPAGVWPLRLVMWRPDRGERPLTALPARPIDPDDGWCDDPGDPAYNRLVRLPFGGRCETLWRKDGLYDVLAVLGYNDDPVVPGAGSAIFLHVAAPDYAFTEGCIALARHDLETLLARARTGDAIEVVGR